MHTKKLNKNSPRHPVKEIQKKRNGLHCKSTKDTKEPKQAQPDRNNLETALAMQYPDGEGDSDYTS